MLHQHIFRRRARESDTGTDEDITRFDSGSPASSDSLFQTRTGSEEPLDPVRNETFTEETAALKCKHADDTQPKPCQNCGGGVANTQYIPIPVPVPIPFPVPASLWANQEAFAVFGSQANMANLDQTIASRLRVVPRNLWPYYTQAALIWPLINHAPTDDASAPATGDFGTLNSVLQNDHSTTAGTTTMPPVAADRDNSLPTTAYSNKTNTETNGDDHKEDQGDSNTVNVIKNAQESEEITGYLECENRYVSSSDTSRDSSDSSDTSGNENLKPRIRRVYNINSGESQRQSDDALPSSNVTSDCDEDERNSHSSVREDDMSSSGSDDTDSDDTGTVADRKPKKFSRIFVVNKNISSSSNASSGSSDTDTSDNDTDTEMDCTVILTNIKPIEESVLNKISIDKTNIGDDEKIIKDKKSEQIPNCDNLSGDKMGEELKHLLLIEETNSESENNTRQIKDREYMSSSPGLSDVSAESLNSSDVEQVRGYTIDVNQKNVTEGYCDKNYEKTEIMDNRDKNEISQSQVFTHNDTSFDGSDKYDEKREDIDKTDNGVLGVSLLKANNEGENYSQVKNFVSIEHCVKNEIKSKDIDNDDGSVILKSEKSETVDQDVPTRRRFSEWNNKIRSNGDAKVGDTTVNTRDQAGGPTTLVSSEYSARNAARYTSLVMITQEPAPSYQQVNVVTSDTTTFVPDNNDVIVQHTNWQDNDGKKNNLEGKLNGKSHVVLLDAY